MSDQSSVLQLTALDALHRAHGARMGAFAGYDMPIQYPAGLKAEHAHTRSACGLFDVSHMGQVRVTAKDGQWATLNAALAKVLALDFADWPIGKQKYSFLLNNDGGIEDDLMALKCADEIRLVLNAGNKQHDLQLLQAACPQLQFDINDNVLLAVQGPDAEAIISALDPAARELRFMTGSQLQLLGAACLATRSGYTGEDGYEISIPAHAALAIVEHLLLDKRCMLIGLGARDTLRLEAGLPLHGNDIGPSTTPVEAALAWAIPKTRRTGGAQEGGFIGAQKVLEQLTTGAKRKLVGLSSENSIPIRAHTPIVDAQGSVVGEVTSGTISPSLNKPVMLAYVNRDALDSDTPLRAQVRQQTPAVHVTRLPFVEKRYKR
jgi:aminomethyltransferase